jgi:hypothetical protein
MSIVHQPVPGNLDASNCHRFPVHCCWKLGPGSLQVHRTHYLTHDEPVVKLVKESAPAYYSNHDRWDRVFYARVVLKFSHSLIPDLCVRARYFKRRYLALLYRTGACALAYGPGASLDERLTASD